MIDSEESCVYCSKCLVGLNDFNKKMHIETCKVRKLVDANRNNGEENQLENFIALGDNCTYCFKSFKDFKSDFNKRIHIKCCKIKKETYEEKNNLKMLARASGNSSTSSNGGDSTEHCIFCTKPLANLNEFNKRMHIENCKIRKSIENNGSNSKNKDDSLIKIGLELGDSCMYCSKSFVNLSDFNKKLHFEYCKLKKKKLQINAQNAANNNQSFNNNNLMNTSTNHQMNITNNSTNNNSMLHDDSSKVAKLDLGETCLFCSRSLHNLSNFNKRIHIETCKVKTLKKASKKLRQTSASANNSLNKSRKKTAKKVENQNNSLNYCQNLNKSLTLDLMGSNNNNTNNNQNEQQKQFNLIQNVVDPNNNDPNSINVTLNTSNMNHFDSLTASLNLNNSITLTNMNQQQQQQQQQQQMKQLIDQSGQYSQNAGGIYIGI